MPIIPIPPAAGAGEPLIPAMGGAGAAPAFIPDMPPGFILPIPIPIGGAGAGVADIPGIEADAAGVALFASEAWSWVTLACSSASCFVSAGSPAGAAGGMAPAAT